MHAIRGLLLALVGLSTLGCGDPLDDVEEPMNVCTYESASCYDETCPPAEDAYTLQCIDTTLDSCSISEGTEMEYDAEVDTTFYFYTRDVQWIPDTTCAAFE